MPISGLSAGDWSRLKRLSGAKSSGNNSGGDLVTNKDINPNETAQTPYSKAMLIPYEAAGVSRTLRPASKWTDFVASGRADFVTRSTVNNNSRVLRVTNICTCTTSTLASRVGLCRTCVVSP